MGFVVDKVAFDMFFSRYLQLLSVTCIFCLFSFFFTYIPCILVIIKVFPPTDAQLDSLKNKFKFALKLTLKAPTCFGVKNTIIREHTI